MVANTLTSVTTGTPVSGSMPNVVVKFLAGIANCRKRMRKKSDAGSFTAHRSRQRFLLFSDRRFACIGCSGHRQQSSIRAC